MENNRKISDELLAKYLDGKTTAEETEEVLAYLAESDENIEDLANISAAVEIMHDVEKGAGRRPSRKFLWVISSVAAAIVAIVICLVAFNRGEGEEGSPLIAEQTDTVRFEPPIQDTVTAVEPTEVAAKEQPEQQSGEFVPIQQAERSRNYAGEMAKVNYASILYPYKDVVYVSLDRKNIDFQWESDAIKVRLEIMDFEDKLLLDKQIEYDNHFLWTLPSIEENAFFWKMTFTFMNGSTKIKQGRIQDENLIIDE